MIALLALVSTSNITPRRRMVTLMPQSQVLYCISNSIFTYRSRLRALSIDDLFCAGDELIFVPPEYIYMTSRIDHKGSTIHCRTNI